MATLYQNPTLADVANGSPKPEGYSTYQKPDTRVPPKAAPLLDSISVNGAKISESDMLAEAQNHPAKNPGDALIAAAQALVVRELLSQEAVRLGVNASPGRDTVGRTETDLDAAIRALVDCQVSTPVAGDEECRRYYRQNEDKFCSEALYEARHILVAARPDDKGERERARAISEELCQRLRVLPDDFADLVEQFSDCSSRACGGNLGQLTRGSTVEPFERALNALKVGEISPQPVESPFGFHIIALDNKVPGERLPFEAVKDQIAGWLEASAWAKAVSQYISILAGRAEITGISLNGADGPLLQ